MGTQGTGRKRNPNKDKSTAEDDALNLIAREAEARLAAKRAARAEAREIRMKELERQQKEIFQVQKKYYGLDTRPDDRGDSKWGDIEQWMEDSERYARSSRIQMISDDDERMSVGSRGSVRSDLDAIGAYAGGGSHSHKKSKKKKKHKHKDRDSNGYDDGYSAISSRSSRLSDESRLSRSSRLDLTSSKLNDDSRLSRSSRLDLQPASYASSDLYSLNGLSSSRQQGSAFNGYQFSGLLSQITYERQRRGSLYEDSLYSGSRRVTGSNSRPSEYSSYRGPSSRASSRASSTRASPVDDGIGSVASFLRNTAAGSGLPRDLDDVTIPDFPNVEDREHLEKGSRAASSLTAATLTSLGGTSSRRGSGDTAITAADTEASIREIKEIHELKDQIQDVESKYMQNLKEVKDTLVEVEEKYRKAMVSNAQLDNEKNNLMYQVDTLKDSLMELEELLSESRREYEEKAKDFEREKHAHGVLQFQFNEMKETLKQSEDLLNEIRQLRMKQDGFVREISDLQETVEWKDKKIGALERQKEYTDAIRIERDELRDEVVKLKDILKKHGIVLGPDLNINGEVVEPGADVSSSGDPNSQPAQDSQPSSTEGNSLLGRAQEIQMGSSGDEEMEPLQLQETVEEANENHSSCPTRSSLASGSAPETTREEQESFPTVGDSVEASSVSKDSDNTIPIANFEDLKNYNSEVQATATVPEASSACEDCHKNDPVLDVKNIPNLSPEVRIIVTGPEENVEGGEVSGAEMEIVEQEDLDYTGKKKQPGAEDVGVHGAEVMVSQSSDNSREVCLDELYEIQECSLENREANDLNMSSKESCSLPGEPLANTVTGNSTDDASSQGVTVTTAPQHENDEDTESAVNEENEKVEEPSEMISDKSQAQGGSASGKKKKKKKRGKKKKGGTQENENTERDEIKEKVATDEVEITTENNLEEAVRGNGPLMEAELSSPHVEILNQPDVDQAKDDQNAHKGTETVEGVTVLSPDIDSNLKTSDSINHSMETNSSDCQYTESIPNVESSREHSTEPEDPHVKLGITKGSNSADMSMYIQAELECQTHDSQTGSADIGNEAHNLSNAEVAGDKSEPIIILENRDDKLEDRSNPDDSNDSVDISSGPELHLDAQQLVATSSKNGEDLVINGSVEGPLDEVETVHDKEEPMNEPDEINTSCNDHPELSLEGIEKEELNGVLEEAESSLGHDDISVTCVTDTDKDSSASIEKCCIKSSDENCPPEITTQSEHFCDKPSSPLESQEPNVPEIVSQKDSLNIELPFEDGMCTLQPPCAETTAAAGGSFLDEEEPSSGGPVTTEDKVEGPSSPDSAGGNTSPCVTEKECHEPSHDEIPYAIRETQQESDDEEEEDEDGQSFDFDEMDLEAAIADASILCPEEAEDVVESMVEDIDSGILKPLSQSDVTAPSEDWEPQCIEDGPAESNKDNKGKVEASTLDTLDEGLGSISLEDQGSMDKEEVTPTKERDSEESNKEEKCTVSEDNSVDTLDDDIVKTSQEHKSSTDTDENSATKVQGVSAEQVVIVEKGMNDKPVFVAGECGTFGEPGLVKADSTETLGSSVEVGEEAVRYGFTGRQLSSGGAQDQVECNAAPSRKDSKKNGKKGKGKGKEDCKMS